MKTSINPLRSLQKLNSSGVAHHLLLALLIVGAVAGFGAYRVLYSGAETVNNWAEQRAACREFNAEAKKQKCLEDVDKAQAEYQAAKEKEKEATKLACNEQGRQYDPETGGCKEGTGSCSGGYYFKDGQCVARQEQEEEQGTETGGETDGNTNDNAGENADGQGGDAADSGTVADNDPDTILQSSNNWAERRSDCRSLKSETKKNNCLSKVDADQAAYQQAKEAKKAECAAQNRHFQESTNACGQCVGGYYDTNSAPGENNVSCALNQVKAACEAMNRVYEGGTDCGGCKSGYKTGDDGKCVLRNVIQEAKAECTASGHIWKDDTNECGNGCQFNYERNGDKCVKLNPVNCADQNRVQVNAYKCGGCISGYTERNNGNCGEDKIASKQAACEAANRYYNTRTNECGQCFVGWFDKDGSCQVRQITKNESGDPIRDCGLYIKNADGSCSETKCVKSYFYRALDSTCVPLESEDKAQALCEASNRVFKDGRCTDECVKNHWLQNGACTNNVTAKPSNVKQACDDQHLVYNAARNICSTTCQIVPVPYYLYKGKCVQATDDQRSKVDECEQLKRAYNPSSNTCATECLPGYAPSANESYCLAIPTMTDAQAKELCQRKGLVYNKTAKECWNTCVGGLKMVEGICIAEEGTTKFVTVVCDPATEDCSDTCKASGQLADCSVTTTAPVVCNPEKQKCSEVCETEKSADACTVPGVPLQQQSVPQTADGDDVAASLTITEADCTLLGREWVVTTGSDGEEVTGCSVTSCNNNDDTVVLRQDSSYCLDAETGGAHATEITQQECVSLHRVWVASAQACAAVPVVAGEGDKFVDAPQCAEGYSTYVVYENGQGECFEASFVDNIQAFAEDFGSTLVAVIKVGPMAFCNLQPNHHWNSYAGSCEKDRDIVTGDEVVYSATAMGNSSVFISLGKGEVTGTDFTIISKTADGTESPVTCRNPQQSGSGSCWVYGLNANTEYTFDVAASGNKVGTTNTVRTAAACVDFTVEAVDNDHVKVTWKSVAGDDITYTITERGGSYRENSQLEGNGSKVVERQYPLDQYGPSGWLVTSHNGTGFDVNCPKQTI